MDLCGPRLCLRHRALGRRRCDWSAALCERIAVLGRVLAAAWRATLVAVAEGRTRSRRARRSSRWSSDSRRDRRASVLSNSDNSVSRTRRRRDAVRRDRRAARWRLRVGLARRRSALDRGLRARVRRSSVRSTVRRWRWTTMHPPVRDRVPSRRRPRRRSAQPRGDLVECDQHQIPPSLHLRIAPRLGAEVTLPSPGLDQGASVPSRPVGS